MKVTKYVYAQFCQYSIGNVRYSILDTRVDECEFGRDVYKNYQFITSIELECLTRDEVVALGVNEFDEELFKLRQQIEAVENKKREMLALPMPEVE